MHQLNKKWNDRMGGSKKLFSVLIADVYTCLTIENIIHFQNAEYIIRSLTFGKSFVIRINKI